MDDEDIEAAGRDPERRKNKREIVIMFGLALALLAAGAVWTMIKGEQHDPEVQGPAIVHDEGPATIPGPAAMPRRRPSEQPRSTPEPVGP